MLDKIKELSFNVFIMIPFMTYIIGIVNINRIISKKYCLYKKKLYVVTLDGIPLLLKLVNKFLSDTDKFEPCLVICRLDVKIILLKESKGQEKVISMEIFFRNSNFYSF